MKTLLALVALTSACVIDDPDVSTDEAEVTGVHWGFEIEGGATSGSVQYTSDPTSASAGAYLAFTGPGYVRYFFNESVDEYVEVWARVKSASQSLIVQIDSNTASAQTLPVAPKWTWVKIASPTLRQGSHSLRLETKEGVVGIDRIIISSEPWFTPITDVYEAETASMVYPMRVASQRLPSVTYAWVPTGGGSSGRLDLDVHVPPGSSQFSIWVRANAISTSSNTIAFGRDGSTTAGVDLPLTSSTGFTWTRTLGMTLDATDVLSIGAWDSGVKIDKVLITNDNGFNLVEASPPPTNSL